MAISSWDISSKCNYGIPHDVPTSFLCYCLSQNFAFSSLNSMDEQHASCLVPFPIYKIETLYLICRAVSRINEINLKNSSHCGGDGENC